MRINEAELIAAQRNKVDELQKAAHACGDHELLRLCTSAIAQRSPRFDLVISWVGDRASEGEHPTRVPVPTAGLYVVLRSDGCKRWAAGEVGACLPNDFPQKYDVKLSLAEPPLPGDDREVPWPRGSKATPRVFYFHAEEVAPFTARMEDAPSGLWTVLLDGRPWGEHLLFAGKTEHEAIATWRRHTKSRVPSSRLSAIPREHAVVLVSAAERTINISSSVESRLEEGNRVSNEAFYRSSLFQRSLAYARTLVEDEHICLLSARYGLERLGGWKTRTTSDDVPLDHLSLDELKGWARRVNHDLLDTYSAAPRVFVVLAADRYVRALEDAAPEGVQWTLTKRPPQ